MERSRLIPEVFLFVLRESGVLLLWRKNIGWQGCSCLPARRGAEGEGVIAPSSHALVCYRDGVCYSGFCWH